MSGPRIPLLLVLMYLYAVYYLLPKYMEHRKPYSLKKTIQIYNLFQILSCVLLVYGVNKKITFKNKSKANVKAKILSEPKHQ